MPTKVGRKETRFIASLFEIPREVGQASLGEFLERIVQRSADWFGATTVSLFLVDLEPNRMSLAATSGEFASIPKKATIELGKGIAGIAARDGSPVLINDGSSPGRKSLSSSMVVPLKTPKGTIGVLNLSRKSGMDRFSESDLRLARSVASHLGLAVENASLVASLQSAVSELESERAKFRGIFDGLGLSAFLLDRHGRSIEENPAAKNLGFFPQKNLLKRPVARKEIDLSDDVTGRSWLGVLNPLPGGMSTLVLEETTERERHRSELDRLNRLAEIGQMTAAIAHEIRNPLTGIRSAAQMVRESPEDAQEFASIIEEEAIKLNELCSEFLNFARPLDLRLRNFQFDEMISRIARLMKPEFDAKQVALDVEIANQMPMIEGDPLRWEQVLHNLMLNALQASMEGGRVKVGSSAEGFWVEDFGCGMATDQIDRLFTPFFTTKPQGTGLGLSTVKKIVDAHRGHILVTSEVGQGTRVDVAFQIRKAA